MKLVRARPKSPDDLPYWAKCCPTFLDPRQLSQEIVVDLENITKDSPYYCPDCGKEHGKTGKGVMAITGRRAGTYVVLELLELDEGAYAEK